MICRLQPIPCGNSLSLFLFGVPPSGGSGAIRELPPKGATPNFGGGLAFTLMEVMLALAISAICLAGIGGVFYSGLRLREHTVAALDESLPVQHGFALLRRDLQGALPPGSVGSLAGAFTIESLGSGLGQNARLHFFTSSGVVNEAAPWGDVQEVVYELREPVERSRSGAKDLFRSVNRNLLTTTVQEPEEQWVAGNVEGLGFAAYDGSDWRDSWDTTLGNSNLPTAVRIRIQIAPDPKTDNRTQEPFETVVSLVSQSRTNLTSTGGTQ
jgi:prepilin-type N-terminal cleavage/methylation domain-containing protein